MGNIFGGGAIGLYLFLYILHGILGALVYEYVVEGEPRDTLDRIATALVLALISALASGVLFGQSLTPHIDIRTETPPDVILGAFLQPKHLLLTTFLSAVVALFFAVAQNHGWVYGLLRFLRMTRKSGRADVWQQTFYLFGDRWISLQFKDERRLVGWPVRFSSSGQPRALLVGDATWYTLDKDGGFVARDVPGPGVYVSSFEEVVSIEILT
jgi:hypothetical protein